MALSSGPVLGLGTSLLLQCKARRLATTILKKSGLADAVGYTLNHWQAQIRYASDGLIEIDSNASERALQITPEDFRLKKRLSWLRRGKVVWEYLTNHVRRFEPL
ncbi:MAG: hypothetical protein CVU33_02475 [Betaproteobacteria bacterium HGW-Betaproteobacteria-6]|nr:MAG: hypothetical protein CVU33_02475 [Betaproteobacteria bacterium HGW-Betaproteobacteria-6]